MKPYKDLLQSGGNIAIQKMEFLQRNVSVGGQRGGRGRGNKAWDRETMFSQPAKQSARQWFYERAGKFPAVISPVSAAPVQR